MAETLQRHDLELFQQEIVRNKLPPESRMLFSSAFAHSYKLSRRLTATVQWEENTDRQRLDSFRVHIYEPLVAKLHESASLINREHIPEIQVHMKEQEFEFAARRFGESLGMLCGWLDTFLTLFENNPDLNPYEIVNPKNTFVKQDTRGLVDDILGSFRLYVRNLEKIDQELADSYLAKYIGRYLDDNVDPVPHNKYIRPFLESLYKVVTGKDF